MKKKVGILSLAVLALAALLVFQPWSTPTDAQSIKDKAYRAAADISSYRMIISGAGTLDGQTSEGSFESEYVYPAGYHARVVNDSQTMEFIIIGKQTYVQSTHDLSPNVVAALTRSFSSMLNQEMSLGIIDQLTGILKLSDERIEGIECFHYLGRMDAERQKAEFIRSIRESYIRMGLEPPGEAELANSIADESSTDHQVEFWIGKRDYILRQVKQAIQATAGSEMRDLRSDFVQKYFDFNQPITIEPPLDSAGRLLPGWRLY